MTLRKTIAVLMLALFTSTFATQDLLAAQPRSMTSAQLHQAVQTSHARAVTARKAINDLLCRADVVSTMRQTGLVPERVRAHVALLSDTEVVRLHRQVMATGAQEARAGLSSGAIVAIVVAGVAGIVILYWIAWHEINEDIYY